MKQKSVSQLKKVADKVFSECIRRKHANWEGFVQCVTCPAFKPIGQMQAGHYESRIYNATRYYEFNVHPQCIACNVFRGGNKPAYALFLQRVYGPKILEELRSQAKRTKQFTPKELENLIADYKEKIKNLKNL